MTKPYHQITNAHDNITLSVVSRQSLKDALDRKATDIFEISKQSFDEYHQMFGYQYPFDEYHQTFVPKFNASTIENPNCVTFHDSMVFQSTVTDDERSQQTQTIMHKMTHQWFNDTITMK